MKGSNLKFFVLGAAMVASGLWAAAVTIPNTFSAGEVLSAAKLNANFAALKTAVDALEAAKPVAIRIPAVANQGNCTIVDHPASNNKPNAVLSVSFSRLGTGIVKPVGPFYFTSTNRWLICAYDNDAQIANVEYHVVIFNP